jgi:hypothetical protein
VEYTTPNGGEKKNRWTNVGIAFENRDRSYNLRFDFLPTRIADTTIQPGRSSTPCWTVLRRFTPMETPDGRRTRLRAG